MLSGEIPESFLMISFISILNFIDFLVNVIRHRSEIKCVTMEKRRLYLDLQVIQLSVQLTPNDQV